LPPVSNIFLVNCKEPLQYVMPATLGGNASSATVRLRNIRGLDKISVKALHPGVEAAVAVPVAFKDGVLELHVPLKRGCAMILLAPT
jgi:hypothetical protein